MGRTEKDISVLVRRELVAKLMLRGLSYQRISEEVRKRVPGQEKCGKSTVCGDVKWLRREWRSCAAKDTDEELQLELRRIDHCVAELWEQHDALKDRNGGVANPACIAEIRQQLMERRKLLGLYAPERRQVEGRVETNLSLKEMSEEDIRREMDRIRNSIANG